MTQRRSNDALRDLDALLEEALVDAHDDDEQLTALATVMDDELETPVDASVVGQPVVVEHVFHSGNSRRGLVARCRATRGVYEVSFADVRFDAGTQWARYAAAFRRWLGEDPFPKDTKPRERTKPAARRAEAAVTKPTTETQGKRTRKRSRRAAVRTASPAIDWRQDRRPPDGKSAMPPRASVGRRGDSGSTDRDSEIDCARELRGLFEAARAEPPLPRDALARLQRRVGEAIASRGALSDGRRSGVRREAASRPRNRCSAAARGAHRNISTSVRNSGAIGSILKRRKSEG